MRALQLSDKSRYGISSFVYRARRPFHPKKLFNLIHDKFITLQNVDQVEDETEEDAEDSDEEMVDSDDDEPLGSSDTEMEDDELAAKEFQKEIPPEVFTSWQSQWILAHTCRSFSRTKRNIPPSPDFYDPKASSGSLHVPASTANGAKPVAC
jgi:hypothetical protein